MEYKFTDRLRQAVLTGRDGTHAIAIIEGTERMVRCPAAGVMGKAGPEGIPCLVSENKAGKGTGYTVVAVQGSGIGGRKEWVCVHPALVEQAIGYFLENGQMRDIAGDGRNVIRTAPVGKCRPDFQAGNTYIEIRSLKTDMRCPGSCTPSLAPTIRQAGRYCSQTRSAEGDDKRIVLLLVCQHGYDGQGRIPCGRMVAEALRGIVEDGVEVWSAEVGMEMDGISLLSYHNMTDCILGW